MRYLGWVVGLAFCLSASSAGAADVSVAVAANFTKPAEELGAAFTAATGNAVTFSFGASGSLFAQIAQGAPFDVFLSADTARPAQAVTEGLGVDGSVFTYAVGALALYGPKLDLADGAAVLAAGDYTHLSIADPESAPYGAAAEQVLQKLALSEAVASKLVVGQNITQTLQFVESGNAELGFVALSQVIDKPASQVWHVPAADYAPIAQNAVLLNPGAADEAAKAFLAFLKSDEAQAIIEKFGYTVAASQ